ncbi:hypothetical protein GCM10011385_39030 [Nitratireductor aestuarii]|uniref:Transposase TnpC homeodomain domain-containing protein n=1 Tax=Nitratireductor aestuarii TaxID=1735103 RepID=A0A916WAT6_9HYPH|nr:hypothetical protein GCM10011385_39030 [Nitratireductor aestuarii]
MTRTGEPSIAELMAQLAANAAEIAALKAEKEALSQRVVKLEEELALAKLHRFAPRSEKHIDRLFNEAEEAAVDGDSEEDDNVELPDTGLPAAGGVRARRRRLIDRQNWGSVPRRKAPTKPARSLVRKKCRVYTLDALANKLCIVGRGEVTLTKRRRNMSGLASISAL